MLDAPLLDHLIGSCQERWRDRDPKRLRRLEVDDQLELGGLLDGQVGGFRTLENLVDVGRDAPIRIGNVRAIGQKTSSINEFPHGMNCRQPMFGCNVHETAALIEEHGAGQDCQSGRACLGYVRERALEILWTSGLKELKLHPQRSCRDVRFLEKDLFRGFGDATWLPENTDSTDPRHELRQQLQTLPD